MPPAISILLSVVTLLFGIISFFLIRTFKKIDDIGSDVTKLLLKDASSGEVQKSLVDDVKELQSSNFDLSMSNAQLDGRVRALEFKTI